MNGQRRHVGRGHHTPDRQGGPQFVAPVLEPLTEQRGGQRGVDEPRGDEVDPDRGELESQGRRERRQRRGSGGHDAQPVIDTPTAGAAHEDETAVGSHRARGGPGHLEVEHDVIAERIADLRSAHLQQRDVTGAARGDHGWSAVVTDIAEPGNEYNRWFAPATPMDVPGVPRGYFVEATLPSP